MMRKSGKLFRLDVIFRLALGAHPERIQYAFDMRLARSSREKPGALQDLLAAHAPPHTTTNAQLKRLLSGRVVGGGDVHVAFVAGDVRERLAVQEIGGHAAKVAPDIDGGAGLHLGTEGGVCAAQAASRRKIAFGCAKNLTQRVFLGLAREAIAAALSTQALNVSSLVHQGYDLLKVLARDVLTLGNVAQRDPSLVNSQVSHCAECVHSLCREHSGHGYSPSSARSLSVPSSVRLLSVPSSVVDAPAAAEPLLWASSISSSVCHASSAHLTRAGM